MIDGSALRMPWLTYDLGAALIEVTTCLISVSTLRYPQQQRSSSFRTRLEVSWSGLP